MAIAWWARCLLALPWLLLALRLLPDLQLIWAEPPSGLGYLFAFFLPAGVLLGAYGIGRADPFYTLTAGLTLLVLSSFGMWWGLALGVYLVMVAGVLHLVSWRRSSVRSTAQGDC